MKNNLPGGRKWRSLGLAEIAGILAIVVLLVGATLKGREIFVSVQVERIERQFRAVSEAIAFYRDRYGVLPGDDPAASSRFSGTWTDSDNGDGNGIISGIWNSSSNGEESRKFWKHLRGAGLVAGPVDSTDVSFRQPGNAYGGLVGIDQGLYNFNGHNIVFGKIPGNIVRLLEARGDDGVPSTGDIQSHESQKTYAIGSLYDVGFRRQP